MEHGPSKLYRTQWPWAGSSSVLVPVPPFISPAILGKSFLGRSIALLGESMGCESFLRTAKCCTIVSYRYIGGGVGEKRSALRDFPPDPTDSRIGLWLQVGQEGPKATCTWRVGLARAAIPEVSSRRQQRRSHGALIPWIFSAPGSLACTSGGRPRAVAMSPTVLGIER